MRISKVVKASDLRGKTGVIYQSVIEGNITELTHKFKEPLVLMTKANFLEMAKQIQDASK